MWQQCSLRCIITHGTSKKLLSSEQQLALNNEAQHCVNCVLVRLGRLALVLVTPFNTMWLLPAGRHALLLDDTVQGTTCGLLPFGVPVRDIETKGLQWDLGGDWCAPDYSLHDMFYLNN